MLFINKTARSGKLSHSRGSERARIYSHVQRGSRTQASSRASKEADVLYQLPDSWIPVPDREVLKSPASSRSRRSTPKDRESQEKADAAADALQTLQLSSKEQKLGPLNLFSGRGGDCFDCLKAPMCPYMEDLLKFCKPFVPKYRIRPLISYVDSSDVVPRVFPVKEVANSARLYTMTQAFEDPLQRDSLLCTTSAAIFAESGIARHGIAAMTFKGKALAALQQQLLQRKRPKASSFSSMYAVALLLYVEVGQPIVIYLGILLTDC